MVRSAPSRTASSPVRSPGRIPTTWPRTGLSTVSSRDRKSTRLNSSHQIISYAVFSTPTPPLPPFPTRRSSDLERQLPGPMTVTGRRRDRLIVARSGFQSSDGPLRAEPDRELAGTFPRKDPDHVAAHGIVDCFQQRSEEHTSELQSPDHLVCRLLHPHPTPPPLPYPTLFRSRASASRADDGHGPPPRSPYSRQVRLPVVGWSAPRRAGPRARRYVPQEGSRPRGRARDCRLFPAEIGRAHV